MSDPGLLGASLRWGRAACPGPSAQNIHRGRVSCWDWESLHLGQGRGFVLPAGRSSVALVLQCPQCPLVPAVPLPRPHGVQALQWWQWVGATLAGPQRETPGCDGGSSTQDVTISCHLSLGLLGYGPPAGAPRSPDYLQLMITRGATCHCRI